ncbi:hypothetical protein N136_00977, partial [Leifsonia aquatica ATCC 14665]
MTTTLALAARLRALRDDALISSLHRRSIRRAGVSDFFDLAEALLDAESVQRALVGLDRTRLAVLIALGRAEAPLTAEAIAAQLAAEPATAGLTVPAVESAVEALGGLLLAQPAASEGTDDDDQEAGPRGFTGYDAVYARLTAWPEADLPSPDDLLHTAPPPALAPVPDTERRFTDR